MKPKFWQSQTFKELEKEWDEKLKESGFEDAEKAIGGIRVLRQRASNCYRSVSAVQRENKQRYFELLNSHSALELFEDRIEALIMARRASGYKIKQICEELRAMNERCHRQTIRLIIQKYELKWGIKKRK